ncbi:hypothetical protein BD626DRAFT_17209 [Schizophyllum amplum]|uniref:Uncharacterized protein n=1 Tax=Schizophyllum amplum TaxID=97359 RepID=A0A550CY60_9AGAR|nr:hypothetical protein BD626DRAFT_17209 [Auriculariopsis ampla]
MERRLYTISCLRQELDCLLSSAGSDRDSQTTAMSELPEMGPPGVSTPLAKYSWSNCSISFLSQNKFQRSEGSAALLDISTSQKTGLRAQSSDYYVASANLGAEKQRCSQYSGRGVVYVNTLLSEGNGSRYSQTYRLCQSCDTGVILASPILHK